MNGRNSNPQFKNVRFSSDDDKGGPWDILPEITDQIDAAEVAIASSGS